MYQWQEWSSGAWTDLGATTTTATKDVSSATRGTRKFRVVVSHAVVTAAESAPVYVTWDEWDIVADMIGKLSAAVASSNGAHDGAPSGQRAPAQAEGNGG